MTSTEEQHQKEIKEALEAIATLKDIMQENNRGLRSLFINRQMKNMLMRGLGISLLLLIFLITNNFFWLLSKDVTTYITLGTFLFLIIGEAIAKQIFQRKILRETTGLRTLSEALTQKGLVPVGNNMNLAFFGSLAVGCGISLQVGSWWYILIIFLLGGAFMNIYASTAFHIRECKIIGCIQLFVAIVLAFFAQSHYEFWVAGSCAFIYASALLSMKWHD